MGITALTLGPYAGAAEQRADGCWLLRSLDPLREYPVRYTEYLARWASTRPNSILLAQRAADGEWRKLTYAAVYEQVQRIAGALLQRGLSAERPLVILSGNTGATATS